MIINDTYIYPYKNSTFSFDFRSAFTKKCILKNYFTLERDFKNDEERFKN